MFYPVTIAAFTTKYIFFYVDLDALYVWQVFLSYYTKKCKSYEYTMILSYNFWNIYG